MASIECFESAVRIHRASGDRAGLLSELINLSVGYRATKQYAEAIAVSEEAESIAQAIRDVRGVGLPEAVAVYQQSLTHSREAGDRLGEAVTPGNLGDACRHP